MSKKDDLLLFHFVYTIAQNEKTTLAMLA